MANRSAAHTQLVRDIRLALGAEPDLVLWLNSIAVYERWDAHAGRPATMRAGLPDGSADLVGILRPGRFVALEAKTGTARRSPAQMNWHALVQAMGGFAAVVRSVSDAHAALARARRGEVQ